MLSTHVLHLGYAVGQTCRFRVLGKPLARFSGSMSTWVQPWKNRVTFSYGLRRFGFVASCCFIFLDFIWVDFSFLLQSSFAIFLHPFFSFSITLLLISPFNRVRLYRLPAHGSERKRKVYSPSKRILQVEYV